MRLIDADNLDVFFCDTVEECGEMIANEPSVDAVPVKYGKWLERECDDGGELWYCSRCHYPVKTIAGRPAFDYCPHCGVNMTEKGAAK